MTKELLQAKLANKQKVLEQCELFIKRTCEKDEPMTEMDQDDIHEMDIKIIKVKAQINLLISLIEECV